MPAGGTFLFFDATPHLRAGETLMGFLERCLDAGVMLTPGSASGQHFENWARLCYTTVPPEDLHAALDRLQRVLWRTPQTRAKTALFTARFVHANVREPTSKRLGPARFS